jgi:hypothetical protein
LPLRGQQSVCLATVMGLVVEEVHHQGPFPTP